MPTTRYRERDQITHVYDTVQQYEMAREWLRLDQDPATEALIRRWARRYAMLHGVRRPSDILELIDTGPPEAQDQFMLTLIELFQSGQQVAGRIALQAMLPKLGAFAFRSSVTARMEARPADRFQSVLCEFWEALTGYPVERRRARVAANLTMDTLNRLTEAVAPKDVPFAPDRIRGLVEEQVDSTVIQPEVSTGWNLDELLEWAVRRNVVSRGEAHLLAEVYAMQPEGRGTLRDVSAAYLALAARTGSKPAAIRQRTHRAKERLAIAVRTAVAGGQPGVAVASGTGVVGSPVIG